MNDLLRSIDRVLGELLTAAMMTAFFGAALYAFWMVYLSRSGEICPDCIHGAEHNPGRGCTEPGCCCQSDWKKGDKQ